jgi:signal transduction histidine kinase
MNVHFWSQQSRTAAAPKRDTVNFSNRFRGRLAGNYVLICLTVVLGVGKNSCPAAEGPVPLSNLSAVTDLAPDEGAKGLPVRATGTVTWSDSERGLLFVQDGIYAVSVRSTNNAANPEFAVNPGQVIEVEGITRKGRARCGIQAAKIRVIRTAELPKPAEVSPADLLTESVEARYVRVKGWVAAMSRSGSRLNLRVFVAPGRSIEFTLKEADIPAARDWPGALVEGVGALALTFNSAGQIQGGRLYLNDETGVRRIQKVPVLPISEISANPDQNTPVSPIRVRGTVAHHVLGDYLIVKDNTGNLRVPFQGLTYFNPGSHVEIFAFPVSARPELVLTNITVKLVLPDSGRDEPAAAILTPTVANSTLPSLTNIMQIRTLSPQEASRGYPVKLTGVITYFDPATYLYFLQDKTSGVYLEVSKMEALPSLQAGQRVAVEGFSGPGAYAPVLIVHGIQLLGAGSFPTPALVTFQKLMTGTYDSQWVSLRGVVRNQRSENSSTILTLHTGDGLIKVTVGDKSGTPPRTNLVDSTVEVHGVCKTVFDDRRRLQNVEVYASDWGHLSRVGTAAPDPFQIAAKPINELFQFHAAGAEAHRVRLMGVVVLRQRDGSFYLQDDSGGIEVQPQDPTAPIQAGATVEVAGFPQMVEHLPTVQDALFRKLRDGTPMEVPNLKTESALDETLHGTLVRLEGQVLRHFSQGSQEWLNMQFGQTFVDAYLEKTQAQDELKEIIPGSTLRLTGVYIGQFDQDGKIQSFRLLLRSKADALVLSRPSWWTARHTLWALGVSAAALLLALGWVRSLRNQVQQRTRELANERDLLKALLENYPDAIYFKDLQSRYVRLSKSKVERAFSVARSRYQLSHSLNGNGSQMPVHLRSFQAFSVFVLGKTDFDFFEEERARAAFEDEQQIIKTANPVLGKIEKAVLPDGQVYWALSTKMPWRDAEGKIIGTFGISKDITSIKAAEEKLEALHKQLLQSSRQAGMAEVATSVLHNVGNVLNSVNVSTNVLHEKLEESRLPSLSKVLALIAEHREDLGEFITRDRRGATLPNYLEQLNEQLIGEQNTIRKELKCLASNMDHIKNIVAMQQSYAKVSGFLEQAQPAELVEDALRFNGCALDRHHVAVERDFAPALPPITVDKHKVLQILVNLIRNAKYACDESGKTEKRLSVSITNGGDHVRIAVSDNGVGIAPENLTRIFNHGFTTRKNGHGFGLHSGALAAKELNGVLRAHSEGLGKGATFTLELPATHPHC